jgi:uncharacterized delta-60 repeat protein
MKKKITIVTLALFITTSLLLKSNSYAQDGSLDLSFGTNGKVITNIGSLYDEITAIAVQSDGKIVVAGYSYPISYPDFAIARYLSNGTLDNSFGTNGIVTTSVCSLHDYGNSMAIQSDGKIIIAGTTQDSIKGYSVVAVARYNSNGTLDINFGNNGIVTTSVGSFNDYGNALALQSNGDITVAGTTEINNNGSKQMFAIRYHSSGIPDLAFNYDGIALTNFEDSLASCSTILIQNDNKIVLAGNSVNNGNPNFAIARFNIDGSPDNTFNTDGKDTISISATINYCNSIALQSNGKIVMAGYSHNGFTTDFTLVRYKTNGIIDSTFGANGIVTNAIGNSANEINSIVIQSDDKILAAGYSKNDNSYDFALARYTINGSIDITFDTDGKLTTDFSSHIDFGRAIALQSDGKIIVAGNSKYNGDADFALARYNNTITGINEINKQVWLSEIYPNPATDIIVVKANPNLSDMNYSVFNLLGKVVIKGKLTSKATTININTLNCGIYFFQVEGQSQQTIKFIKE